MSHDEAGQVKRETHYKGFFYLHIHSHAVSMTTSNCYCEMRHSQSSMDPAQTATYVHDCSDLTTW